MSRHQPGPPVKLGPDQQISFIKHQLWHIGNLLPCSYVHISEKPDILLLDLIHIINAPWQNQHKVTFFSTDTYAVLVNNLTILIPFIDNKK